MFGARILLTFLAAGTLAACGTSPEPLPKMGPKEMSLPDRTAFSQKDPRWANDRMGGSGASMEAEGCLVTAAAMALSNMGFQTNPGDLNKRLKQKGGYTGSGQLIWKGISDVTNGKAQARFYTTVSNDIIDGCMADGYYPLARFTLANGRTHWAVILHRNKNGYYMRDPLHPSKRPLLFPRGVDAFEAVRCVGPA